MEGPFRAVLDASVLYPVTLRNLLMRLAPNGLFQAHWSKHVHEEWIRAVLRDRPDIPVERLHAVRDAMNEHAEESLVNGYEGLIEALYLPDIDDRHVLAAAIVGHADVIVTHNVRDFPQQLLERYGIEAQHPDEFVRHLPGLAPTLVVDALRDQQTALTRPPMTMEEVLELLERIGLVETVAELRRVLRGPGQTSRM
jgi:predicted nucleic acid-binding protein